MNTMPATRVEGEAADLGKYAKVSLEWNPDAKPIDITSFNTITNPTSDLELLTEGFEYHDLSYSERRTIKRTQCERGEVPTRHLPTPSMGWFSMYHFCNDALCKRCGPYLANQAKKGTELHLKRVGKKKIRRVTFEVGNQGYGYLRDRINRRLARYGIKRRIYPHEDKIIVHMDGHVKFTSFNTTTDSWLMLSEIDWLHEIRGARGRKQSGNLFPKPVKKVADIGVEVLVERLAVERGTSREILGRAMAESMKAVDEIDLPSAESMLELDPISFMRVQDEIQACYDLMTSKFREVISNAGVEIVGNTRVRVSYLEKESVSKILVTNLAMREANSLKILTPIE